MIFQYRFGKPFETEAVVRKDLAKQGEKLLYLENKEGEAFTYSMGKEDVVYGLGENVRGINKRGWIYQSKCSDDPNHQEDTRSLYGAHNFLIVKGKETFGLFFDYAGIVAFDVGYTKREELKVTFADWNFDLYLITGENVLSIIKEFRTLIGRSYIAPRWAFGYGQSRWSYMNEEEVRAVVRGHEENDLPLDMVYLDIDYMERYKDFTVSEEAFPDFEGFVEEMKEAGVHLIPIIDAGVKKEEGYPVYEEGQEKGYFCKKEDGSDFVAAVWPGHAMFPDFLNKEAREWFGNQYAFLLDKGIDGFWNDMNEPAIFYTEDRLRNVLKEIGSFQGKNLDMYETFRLKELVNGMANNEEDYRNFYHDVDGVKIRHDKVHNLYGCYMTRAAGEAFERLRPEERILMFSRASYIGMHRYGGIWQGDNKSWWSHLLMNIKMCPSLNMCGFLYTGADMGGFGADTTEDLLLRWMEFAIFAPLLRNHSAMGTRRQELYEYEDVDAFRNLLKFRYRLLPYLYSEYMKAALRNEMYFMPMAFLYPEDSFAPQVEDQLFVGKGLMVAPVYEQNAGGRYVYLPEEMRMFRLQRDGSLKSEILGKGHHYVEVKLEELVFFLRKGYMLPLAQGGSRVNQVNFEKLSLLVFGEGEAEYEYYMDDGEGKDYENLKNVVTLRASEDRDVSL